MIAAQSASPGLAEAPSSAELDLVGADLQVPLVTGGSARFINLDYAASTPPLAAVARAVEALLPWYSSVRRGAGFKSRVATAVYEGARESVQYFFGGRPDDAVVFTRNTTDSLNLLAHSLPEGTRVIAFAGEHHANLLRCISATSAGIRRDLLQGDHSSKPGAVRMSLGLGTTRADIDALAKALQVIAGYGARWTYRRLPPGDAFEPDPDPHPWPSLPVRVATLASATAWEAS